LPKIYVMTTTKLPISLLILFFTQLLMSQDIVTDRPDQTESSSTVGNKTFQIEMGAMYLTASDNDFESFMGPQMLLRYGITNGIELRFATQFESSNFDLGDDELNFNGINDLQIGAKFQLLKKDNMNTEIAFLSHLVVPVSENDLASGKLGIINKLAISHVISNTINVGYNIGYDYLESTNFLTYSLAVGIGISEVVGLYVEPFGAWGESNIFESNFDVGFTFLLNPNFQLDTSYGLGLNNNMNYYSVGFSWRNESFLKKQQQ